MPQILLSYIYACSMLESFSRLTVHIISISGVSGQSALKLFYLQPTQSPEGIQVTGQKYV